MVQYAPYIVYAEFLHVSMKGSTEEAIIETFVRHFEGSHVTTVVRFYDHDEQVLRSVRRVTNLEEKLQKGITHLGKQRSKPGFIKRFLLDVTARKLRAARYTLAELTRVRFIEELPGRDIIIDRGVNEFNPILPEERHELQEAVQTASAVRVIIFEHGPLTVDPNHMLAHTLAFKKGLS